jgi:hypothetical protein
MLAERLLSKGGDYSCDRELRTLELLKVRFGEGSLHNAEVMLKVGTIRSRLGCCKQCERDVASDVGLIVVLPALAAVWLMPAACDVGQQICGGCKQLAGCHGLPVSCPVQDLGDSKRVNANVHSVPNTATPLRRRRHLVSIDALSATIVSQLFWPPLPQQEFKLPPEVCFLSPYLDDEPCHGLVVHEQSR